MQFFRAEQKVESVTGYFMRLKKITVELGLLLPFFIEKETSFFIINKLNVQENYTMKIIWKPRIEGEKEKKDQ